MNRIITFLLIVYVSALSAQEKVEFRGIERSGHYDESGLIKKWPENGPELILKIEGIGKGFSQPIVAEGKIFTSGIKEDTIDILSAYNMKGEMLWDVPYGLSWTRTYIDSRSTPTYENGKIFIVSGRSEINCVNANSGKIIWQIDAIKEFGAEPHKHGETESLLLTGDAVLYTTGGEENTMVALSKEDGSLIWKSKSLGGAKSYASAVKITHNGREIILAQTTQNLIAIDAGNGEILWSYDLFQYHWHRSGKGAHTIPPIYSQGKLFVTSGYEHPGIQFSLSGDGHTFDVLWKNDTIDTHHGGVVLVDGNIYGSNWQSNARGRWVSVNWETGRTNWEQEWENKGSIVTADGMLYIYEEKRGNVALVEPSSDSLKIISTFKVEEGAGPHWAHPAIYNGHLYLRHGEVLLVYNVRKE